MTNETKWPPLDPGTRVKTTKSNTPNREWMPEALVARKWGVMGTVVKHHDSHGLCYDVRHDDGTEGCYDPSEFELVNKKYAGLSREKLAAHADEGWDLANKRTKQLREAVEALRGADWVLTAFARRLNEDNKANVNLKELYQVLEWGGRMFPEPGASHHDTEAEAPPKSNVSEK